MGMMDLALGALAVILVGGYAKKSGAGLGLTEISGGIVDLISAPLIGSATGITAFSESIGGLGRGLGDFWESMPDLSIPFIPPIAGTSNVVTGNGVNGVNGINGIQKISHDIGNGTDAGGGSLNAGGEENVAAPPIIQPPIDQEEQWSAPALIQFPLPQIRRENGYWVT
jgi:hypothetical protein